MREVKRRVESNFWDWKRVMDNVEQWAEEQFGQVGLGDQRRTERVVWMAARMAARPMGSLPQQMGDWRGLKAAYRLLDNAAVSHEALSRPHWEQTRQQASMEGQTVLMVSDITELDYSPHPSVKGLGPIGNHRGQGLMVHNTLAIVPETKAVIGLAYQQVWIRDQVVYSKTESRAQRRQRDNRQSRKWGQAGVAVGRPPATTRWVYVADRESDLFEFFHSILDTGAAFCVRAQHDRRVMDGETMGIHLMQMMRALPAQGERELRLPAQRGQAERTATLSVSWYTLTLVPPRGEVDKRPVTVTVVRTWEAQPPQEGVPLEWLLLTSVVVNTLDEALERMEWYTARWVVEEYHSCLKTGCQIEAHRLQERLRLERLLAFLSIMAVRLLQLRDLARQSPQVLALTLVEPLLVQVMAQHLLTDPRHLSASQFWQGVASLGGFPGRKSDGRPGWKRLWVGWLYLLQLAQGVRLAQSLPPL